MRAITITILFFCTVATMAQNGKIKGRVTDAQSGEPLESAAVAIEGTQTIALTDSSGYYILNNAPVGFRRLLFQSTGYADFESEPVQVTTAIEQTVNAQMLIKATEAEQVTVVYRNTRRIENPPLSTHRLNIKEIEKSPGGNRDISKVVQNLPGVVATPINRNDLIVRGGGPNENKFYLDRIEIPVINHFQTQGASGGNASLINSDFLSGATLYTSAFPASRGNALSSVLDLRMKEGNPDKFKTKFAIGASDVGLTIDTPLGKKGSLIASYRVSYLQFLFQILELPFLPTYQDAQFKFSYHFDDRNSIYVLGLGSFDKSRLNLSMSNLPPDRQQILDYLPENDQWSYVMGAVYNHRTKNGSLDFIVSTNRLSNSLQKWQSNDPALGKNLDYRSNEIEAKTRLEYNTNLGRGYVLNTGISLDRGYYDNNTRQRLFFGETPIENAYSTNLYLTRYAGYAAIDKLFFRNKLRINLSTRFDGNNFSSSTSNPLRQFSPRMALSYEFVPKWAFNANVGRYFQEPGYATMGYRNRDGELANSSSVGYIRSDQFTAGFSFAPRSGQKISVEGFYKGYDHYPISLVDSTAIGSTGQDVFAIGAVPAASAGVGRAYGLELMYRNEDLWGFFVNFTYTYYFSEFRKMDRNFAATGPYIPSNWDNRHLVTLMISREIARGWEIGARWRFAGGSPSTPYDVVKSSQVDVWEANKRPVLDYSLLNSERLPSFQQLDLRVDKTWYFKKWTFALYIDVQNLYNYKAYGNDILMPETDLNGNYIKDPNNPKQYIMKSYPNEIGGTIIPTFGVIVEF